VARKHVGDNPFAVLLGDDLMVDDAKVLSGMIAAHEERNASVVALRSVPQADISSYGCADPGEAWSPDGGSTPDGTLVPIKGIVEKPRPEDAPSSLAVMGRYVFTPDIFDALELVKPGVGGEIQLTDAIALLLGDADVFGYVFRDGRYDIGSKLDYLRATVELALERDDLGPPFAAFLTDLVERRGLHPDRPGTEASPRGSAS
jgi:UTP--glucose-1-phosphate uridylyltransferase